MRGAGPAWGHQGWAGGDQQEVWEESLSWGWDRGEEMAQRLRGLMDWIGGQNKGNFQGSNQ